MNSSFDDLQCEDVYGNNEDAVEFAALCELERQEIWQTVDDTEHRKDFIEKIENQRFKTAELVNGNGFVQITGSWAIDHGSGPVAYVAAKFQRSIGIWCESDLKNFCL